MVNYYFNIGLIYFIIGFAAAIVSYYIFRKDVIGHFLGALIVGLIGSFLGGALEHLFANVIRVLTNINGSVNIFPPLITSGILLWIFVKASDRYHRDAGEE
jgi:uncharacterized membrane protein YeaQ/YmgE (transglycosylase-associated protein family)